MYLLFCVDDKGKMDLDIFEPYLCSDLKEIKEKIDYYTTPYRGEKFFHKEEFRYIKINPKDIKQIK